MADLLAAEMVTIGAVNWIMLSSLPNVEDI